MLGGSPQGGGPSGTVVAEPSETYGRALLEGALTPRPPWWALLEGARGPEDALVEPSVEVLDEHCENGDWVLADAAAEVAAEVPVAPG